MAELMGGTYNVHSRAGRQSLFYILRRKNKMFGQYPEQAVDEPAYVKLTEEIANYKFYYTQSSECFEVSVERDGCTRFSLEALGEALWLGIWVNQKGFHDQYCLALEPATAPNDAPAPIAENGKKCALTAKEWMLKIKVREAE